MKNYNEIFVRELINRNYARNTIKNYSSHLKHFLEFSVNTNFNQKNALAYFLKLKQQQQSKDVLLGLQ